MVARLRHLAALSISCGGGSHGQVHRLLLLLRAGRAPHVRARLVPAVEPVLKTVGASIDGPCQRDKIVVRSRPPVVAEVAAPCHGPVIDDGEEAGGGHAYELWLALKRQAELIARIPVVRSTCQLNGTFPVPSAIARLRLLVRVLVC